MLLSTLLSSTIVLISVTDINDNDPQFMEESYGITFFENSIIGTTDSTFVGEVTDLDSGSNALLSYSVAGTSKTYMYLEVLCTLKYVISYVLLILRFVYSQ